MIDGNVKGLLYVSKMIMPQMRERQSGHIINISSVAARQTYAGGVVSVSYTHLDVYKRQLYMIVSRTKMHLHGEEKMISQNYLKTFLNGFLFNILNIGVVLFWLVTVVSVRNAYPDTRDFLLYMVLVLSLIHI